MGEWTEQEELKSRVGERERRGIGGRAEEKKDGHLLDAIAAAVTGLGMGSGLFACITDAMGRGLTSAVDRERREVVFQFGGVVW